MQLQSYKSTFPSREVISNQLERMLNSSDFRATPQQTDFFKYVVNQTLAGNAEEIKGYTVATEVFGRGPDFDQSIDPVVSIQAGRLRRAIERYYLTGGKNDPARIDIPKGTYVLKFSERAQDGQHAARDQGESVGCMPAWPTILVRPLKNLTANPDDDFLTTGLATELAHALSHYREIRVLDTLHRAQRQSDSEISFDFIMEGDVRSDPVGIKVSLRLCDARTGLQIWSGSYQGDLEAAKMISFQEDVAAEVAFRMAGGNAVIPRHLSGLSKNKSEPEMSTYEAMLRYWEYDTLRTCQSYLRAIRALEHAVVREPDCGQTQCY